MSLAWLTSQSLICAVRSSRCVYVTLARICLDGMHNVASPKVYAVIFIIVLQKEEEESNMDVAELAD